MASGPDRPRSLGLINLATAAQPPPPPRRHVWRRLTDRTPLP